LGRRRRRRVVFVRAGGEKRSGRIGESEREKQRRGRPRESEML